MDKEFTVGYSYKTFDGIIGAGIFDVEADSIETVKEAAFSIVVKKIKDDHDEESDFPWDHDFQNLQCSVTKK